MIGSRRTGFTLLETVSALALFVLCAGLLLQTIGNTRTAVDATWAAESQDADLRLMIRTVLGAPDIYTAKRDGIMDAPDGARWTWKCDVEPTETTDLHRVSVRFTREIDGESKGMRTIVLFALRPAWSDPSKRAALLEKKRAALPESERRRR